MVNVEIADALRRADHVRRSPSRYGGAPEYKEWQHFLVHAGGLQLLLNFNLLDDRWATDPRRAEIARVICVARTDRWQGCVERFDGPDLAVSADGHHLRFGANELQYRDGVYHLTIRLPELTADLRLTPLTAPALANNQSLSAARTLCWLFVPRLEATGTVRAGGRTFRIRRAPAYHDHNWGYFRWGDDFSWEWGSGVPARAGNPWSAVFMRMGDRGRTVARCQGLYLWKGRHPRRVFRDDELSVEQSGQLRQEQILRLPPVMSLLAAGSGVDVPRLLRVVGQSEGDEVELRFHADAFAQILVPNENEPTGITVLNEVCGTVALSGRVRGETMAMEGPGVFEFVT
jgi:hypothetical protein